MASAKIAMTPGDGIGPEIMRQTLRLFEAAGVTEQIEFVDVEMGERVFAAGDSRGMTDEAIEAVESCGLLFKGPMATPKGSGGKSINVTARKMWGAFANLRHFQSLPGVETVFSKAGVPVDFYVVRENIEDTYGAIEHRLTPDVVECLRLISAPGSDQVHRFAFEAARRLGVNTVHCGHKANIMKATDGLFLDRFYHIGQDYPDIDQHDVIIDALCMRLVLEPQNYAMVVLPNLQGDIVSDLAAGLVGGLGFAPSANIGRRIGIFEAVHGTAPDIAGKGIANPTALIMSGLMMLRHIHMFHEAAHIENALFATLETGIHTGDFGDPATEPVGTEAYVSAIIDRLGKTPTTRPAIAVPDKQPPTMPTVDKPSHNEMMQTLTNTQVAHVGADVYLGSALGPLELADRLGRICEHSPFKLTMISNRGTQVWPAGSTYTDLVDHHRCRFELRDRGLAPTMSVRPAVALLGRIAETFEVVSFTPLKTYDGKPGYSLAQGQ